MNLLEVYVVDVVVKEHKIDNNMYSKTIITDCYGIKNTKTITGDWNYVRKYKIGYKWLE